MRLVARLFMLVLGLALAIPAGGLALLVGILLEPAASELLATWGVAMVDAIFAEAARGGAPELLVGSVALGLWTLCATLLVAPPTLVALVGETVGTRAMAWYGGACGLLTALVPWAMRPRGSVAALAGLEGRLTALLFLAGAVVGLVYWLVSGRSAGRPPQPLPPAWDGSSPGLR
ncbi:MAG TPA: hypothetical protein VEA41_11280 [Salinarimonas sp.]|nr:hypothetical protein [Salinarimonas sp.]